MQLVFFNKKVEKFFEIPDDNLATLKKIYREKDRIRLQPANPTLFPIYRNEVEIRGVVVRVVRNLESENISLDSQKFLNEIEIKNETFERKDFKLFSGFRVFNF